MRFANTVHCPYVSDPDARCSVQPAGDPALLRLHADVSGVRYGGLQCMTAGCGKSHMAQRHVRPDRRADLHGAVALIDRSRRAKPVRLALQRAGHFLETAWLVWIEALGLREMEREELSRHDRRERAEPFRHVSGQRERRGREAVRGWLVGCHQ